MYGLVGKLSTADGTQVWTKRYENSGGGASTLFKLSRIMKGTPNLLLVGNTSLGAYWKILLMVINPQGEVLRTTDFVHDYGETLQLTDYESDDGRSSGFLLSGFTQSTQAELLVLVLDSDLTYCGDSTSTAPSFTSTDVAAFSWEVNTHLYSS